MEAKRAGFIGADVHGDVEQCGKELCFVAGFSSQDGSYRKHGSGTLLIARVFKSGSLHRTLDRREVGDGPEGVLHIGG